MFDGVCRPWRRLFSLAVICLATHSFAQQPARTTISDVIYRADSTPAQGTLIISWPGFTLPNGQAIAGGDTSTTLGPGGTLSVALVPNAGAIPANTVYTVVYQLDDVVRTEYWSVPTTSPATLAQVRVTLGTTGSAAQMATQQFVQSAVADKAEDSAVVHLSGAETVSGVKQFSVSPSLPTPSQPTDGVNKQYVDQAVQNVGTGSYLNLTGGSLSGPLFLNSDPTLSNQAATKHYTDMWVAAKADLIAGFVPPSELGGGTPGANTCLLGNSTWGPCPAGGSSSYINSTLVANPNFNATTPPAQSKFLNCTFENSGSNVSLECPYGNSASAFALGSQAVLNNQANAFAGGLQDFTAASLKLPSGAGYAPATPGAIGFDTTANMPVVNVNGLTQQLALTTSNISGQASTALALATTPLQCNGSFATGIQANGNANCSTADVIELSETAPPKGIPGYGIFWFDAATHTPRVIDNNGQVVQLALTNAFNTDANTLEEYNGTTPQTLNVYGTRADAADYERMRLGYDTADGYFFLGSDAAGSGNQRGLGFWLGGSLRWAIDNGFNLKPWSDNLKDIGAPTLRVHNLYLGTGLVFGSGTLTGVHGSTGTALEASTVGTTAGAAFCNDGNGNATDVGCPSGGGVGSVFGRLGAITAQAGDYSVAQVTGAAPLASPNFTGTPTAPTPATSDDSTKIATTDFTQNLIGTTISALNTTLQSQIGVLAPLISPALAGTPTAPTVATSDNSTSIATTAWVRNQGYGSGGGLPSGSQYQRLVNTNGGAAYATSAAGGLDASADSAAGTNDYLAISHVATSPQCANGCIIDGSGLPGSAPSASVTITGSATKRIKIIGWKTNQSPANSVYLALVNNVFLEGVQGATKITANGGTSTVAPLQVTGDNSGFTGTEIAGNRFQFPKNGTSGAHCVLVGSGRNILIRNNFIHDCGNDGISFSNGSDARIEDNLIQQTEGPNLQVNAASGGPYYHDVIHHNRFYDGCIAGNAACSGYNVNIISASGAGLLLYPEFTDNEVMNDIAGGDGTGTTQLCNNPATAGDGNGNNAGGNAPSVSDTGCNGMQFTNNVRGADAHGNVIQYTGTEGIATGGIYQNVHDNYCTLVGVLWSGSANTTNGGSGCVLFFLQADGTTTGYSQIHDNYVTDGGYVVKVGVGHKPGGDVNGAVVTNLDIHDNHGFVQSSVGLSSGLLVANGTSSSWTFQNSTVADNDFSFATNPVSGSGTLPTFSNVTLSGPLGWAGTMNSTVAGYLNGSLQVGGGGVDSWGPVVVHGGASSFAGTVTAPTPAFGDNSAKVATTAYVQAQTTGLPWFTQPFSNGNGITLPSSANKAYLYGVVLTYPLSTTQVTYYVVTPDSSANTYDIGIYQGASGSSDTLLAHVGATAGTAFAGSTGWKTLTWSAPVTLQPGRYYLAITSSCTSGCAQIGSGSTNTGFTFDYNNALGVANGGTLPASITGPADNYTVASIPVWSVH